MQTSAEEEEEEEDSSLFYVRVDTSSRARDCPRPSRQQLASVDALSCIYLVSAEWVSE